MSLHRVPGILNTLSGDHEGEKTAGLPCRSKYPKWEWMGKGRMLLAPETKLSAGFPMWDSAKQRGRKGLGGVTRGSATWTGMAFAMWRSLGRCCHPTSERGRFQAQCVGHYSTQEWGGVCLEHTLCTLLSDRS